MEEGYWEQRESQEQNPKGIRGPPDRSCHRSWVGEKKLRDQAGWWAVQSLTGSSFTCGKCLFIQGDISWSHIAPRGGAGGEETKQEGGCVAVWLDPGPQASLSLLSSPELAVPFRAVNPTGFTVHFTVHSVCFSPIYSAPGYFQRRKNKGEIKM